MLRDQRRNPRPRGQGEQALDEARAHERAGTKALAPAHVARVKLRDQRGDFGRVEKFRNVAYSRATRYLLPSSASASARRARSSASCAFRGSPPSESRRSN